MDASTITVEKNSPIYNKYKIGIVWKATLPMIPNKIEKEMNPNARRTSI